MRTASVLTILMIIPILFAGVTLASPPTNGTTTTVSDSQTWNGGNFNGDVIVASGGVLTWTGESQISTDSTITVEEGGTLNLHHAELTGQSSASRTRLFLCRKFFCFFNLDQHFCSSPFGSLKKIFEWKILSEKRFNFIFGVARNCNASNDVASKLS